MATTSNPQVKIVNVETGEEIVRDANAEEIAQMQTDAENETAKKAAESQRAADRAALLAQLGITAEQAKLLLQ
jgi:hypothetical protein